jgi:hypothetical protein
MLLKDTGGGDFDPAPAGSHLAVCVQVVDVGTQHWDGPYGHKSNRKIRIAWELPNEKKVFDEKKGPESILVSAEYTASLNERANLRHVLESWRGKAFTPEELEGFDAKNLLGKSCLVTIVHEKKKDKVYGNVKGVASLPKGMEKPVATLPQIYFSLEPSEFDPKIFQQLPEWLRTKIAGSDEGKVLISGQTSDPSGGNEHASAPAPDDDEIPF